MQLFATPTSPYVRLCRIVARERGVSLTETPIDPDPAADAAYLAANPAGHGPALGLDDGSSLTGWMTICARLGEEPSDWDERGQMELANAALGFLVAMRGGLPPSAGGWGDGLARVLDALEAADLKGLGRIATAVALTYADFRHPGLDWRTARPRLMALQTQMEARENFRATAPA